MEPGFTQSMAQGRNHPLSALALIFTCLCCIFTGAACMERKERVTSWPAPNAAVNGWIGLVCFLYHLQSLICLYLPYSLTHSLTHLLFVSHPLVSDTQTFSLLQFANLLLLLLLLLPPLPAWLASDLSSLPPPPATTLYH